LVILITSTVIAPRLVNAAAVAHITAAVMVIAVDLDDGWANSSHQILDRQAALSRRWLTIVLTTGAFA
jgi:hypothetical protein